MESIFNLFKKAVDKAADAVDKLLERNQTPTSPTSKPVPTPIAEKKVQETLPEEPPCEKGICYANKLSYTEEFYCTCDDKNCPVYIENQDKHMREAVDDRMIAYLKRYKQYKDKNAFDEMVKEIFPSLYNVRQIIIKSIKRDGISEENRFLILAKNLKDVNLSKANGLSEKLDFLREKTDAENFDEDATYHLAIRAHIKDDFFTNPSLYELSFEDFKYVEYIYISIADDEMRNLYFEESDDITMDALFDENGMLKPTGRAIESLSTDTIHGVVEEWTRLYGKDEE